MYIVAVGVLSTSLDSVRVITTRNRMLLGRYKVEPDNLHASPVGMVYVPSSLFLIMLLLLVQRTNPSELPSKDLRTAPHVVHMVGEEHLRSA